MLIQPAFQTRVIENVWVGCLLPQCSQAWVITSILCGTLSKALEKSRNSTCELDCLSRVLAHSCTVSNNCVRQECPLLKPCWDGLSLLCLLRKFMIFPCTKHFITMLVRLTGLYSSWGHAYFPSCIQEWHWHRSSQMATAPTGVIDWREQQVVQRARELLL